MKELNRLEESWSRVQRKFHEMSTGQICPRIIATHLTPQFQSLIGVIQQGERKNINYYDVVGKIDLAITMIARNWRENLVLTCSVKVNTNIPIQVETLRWVVSITIKHKLINVSFESDCQVCIQGRLPLAIQFLEESKSFCSKPSIQLVQFLRLLFLTGFLRELKRLLMF